MKQTCIYFLTQKQQAYQEIGKLVAHNMSFDKKIVGAEFLRNGMQNSIATKRKICTMGSTTNFCAIHGHYGYKWPKLSELHYKLFKTNFEEAHKPLRISMLPQNVFGN
jgi:DNA polymerase-3 subunit epsilon